MANYKLYIKIQRPKNTQDNFLKKEHTRRSYPTQLQEKLQRLATEVKTVGTSINTPLTDQWNMTECPKIDIHLNSHLIFRKGAKAVYSGDKTKLFLTNGAVIN